MGRWERTGRRRLFVGPDSLEGSPWIINKTNGFGNYGAGGSRRVRNYVGTP